MRTTGFGSLGAGLAACLLWAVPAQAMQEAPMLAEMVAAGNLPPLEERLPANPLVLQPIDSVGSYGGTWRSGLRGGADNAWLIRTVAYDGLVRFDRNWDQIIPNLAESWEVSEDGRRYSFTLRDGLKWSDGQPFTSADIAFAASLLSEPRYATRGGWLNDPDNPVTVEIEDDLNFTFVLQEPNGLVLNDLASVNGNFIVSLSKSYCGQFYPETGPDADQLAAENEFGDWAEMLIAKCSLEQDVPRWGNPEAPTMNGWMLETPLTGNATRVTLVRNPYYWKVDPEGNQLPYIDRMDMRVTDSLEELTLLALNGQIDFQDRHLNTTANQAIFFDGQEAGNYVLGPKTLDASSALVFQLNLNHVDEARRALFGNKDFRIGLSHAIDREEIIDVVYAGQSEPYQVSPRPESRFFDEEMSKQYTEFDPDLAARHFEAAGLVRNEDGFYTMADGSSLTITVDSIAGLRQDWIDILELMSLQLEMSGINLDINNIDRTLFYDKRAIGDYDAQIWEATADLTVIDDPRYYMPFNHESAWAFRWQAWFNDTSPDIAEEPADWAKRQMELYREAAASPSVEDRDALTRQIIEIAKENFPVIGISLPPNSYYIASADLRNVPEQMIHGWLFPTPAPYDPVQWYFDR